MTSFNIDGPIATITTKPDSIQTLAAGTLPSPQTISPASGGARTIIIAQDGSNVNQNYFQLSSSFNIGDIIEIYNDSTAGAGMTVIDENSNNLSIISLSDPGGSNKLSGAKLRKLRSNGSGYNWGIAEPRQD